MPYFVNLGKVICKECADNFAKLFPFPVHMREWKGNDKEVAICEDCGKVRSFQETLPLASMHIVLKRYGSYGCFYENWICEKIQIDPDTVWMQVLFSFENNPAGLNRDFFRALKVLGFEKLVTSSPMFCEGYVCVLCECSGYDDELGPQNAKLSYFITDKRKEDDTVSVAKQHFSLPEKNAVEIGKATSQLEKLLFAIEQNPKMYLGVKPLKRRNQSQVKKNLPLLYALQREAARLRRLQRKATKEHCTVVVQKVKNTAEKRWSLKAVGLSPYGTEITFFVGKSGEPVKEPYLFSSWKELTIAFPLVRKGYVIEKQECQIDVPVIEYVPFGYTKCSVV